MPRNPADVVLSTVGAELGCTDTESLVFLPLAGAAGGSMAGGFLIEPLWPQRPHPRIKKVTEPFRKPVVILSGGETTVSIGGGPAGKGGRNS